MFYIREISGQVSPYAPGSIRPRRGVTSVTGVAPAVSQGEVRSPLEFSHPTSEKLPHSGTGAEVLSVITAYERALKRDSPRRRLVLASELMTTAIVTIPQSATLKDAHVIFSEKRFRHVPVVDDSSRLVGMLSDRDLLRRAAHLDTPTTGPAQPWQLALVESVMSHPVIVASGDTEIREVANAMFQDRIGCMPIVDQGQQVVGIITRSDILRTLLIQAPLELWR